MSVNLVHGLPRVWAIVRARPSAPGSASLGVVGIAEDAVGADARHRRRRSCTRPPDWPRERPSMGLLFMRATRPCGQLGVAEGSGTGRASAPVQAAASHADGLAIHEYIESGSPQIDDKRDFRGSHDGR